MVAFCWRILAQGRWNLEMSLCKCPGDPRGQPTGKAADKCIMARSWQLLFFSKFWCGPCRKRRWKYKGWRMVLQKFWVSQNFSPNSRVSQSRFFNGYLRPAVSFFIRRCLEVSIFCKTKGLEVPIRLFVCFKMTPSRHSRLNFVKATFNFREILTFSSSFNTNFFLIVWIS